MNTNLTILIIVIAYYFVNVIYDLFFANKLQLKKSNSNEIDLSHFDTKPASDIDNIKAKIVKSNKIGTPQNPVENSENIKEPPKEKIADEINNNSETEDIKDISNVDKKNKEMEETAIGEEQAEMATGITYETIELNDNSLTIKDLEEQQDFIVNEANLLTYTNLKRKIG